VSAVRTRPIAEHDYDAVVDVYLTSRATAMPWVAWAHGEAAVRRWFKASLLPAATSWIAERGGAVVGFVCVEDGVVSQLYVHPSHARDGIGRALLSLAKDNARDGLTLRCFARNSGARAFYAANGFIAVDESDGSANEEKEPDVTFVWRPR
jgi:GNAT superfamily N-acetyltransferase